MQTLSNFWHTPFESPKAGDFILFQVLDDIEENNSQKYYKPVLALVIEGLSLDMAAAIHYVKYRRNGTSDYWDTKSKKWVYDPPKVELVYDWMSPEIQILKHWTQIPSFEEVFKAYRNRNDFEAEFDSNVNFNINRIIEQTNYNNEVDSLIEQNRNNL